MTDQEPNIIANFELLENTPIEATFSIDVVNNDLTYIHNQDVPAASWSITHNLGKCPSVTIVTSAGEQVQADVQYIDSNNIQIDFVGAFAGKAYLN